MTADSPLTPVLHCLYRRLGILASGREITGALVVPTLALIGPRSRVGTGDALEGQVGALKVDHVRVW